MTMRKTPTMKHISDNLLIPKPIPETVCPEAVDKKVISHSMIICIVMSLPSILYGNMEATPWFNCLVLRPRLVQTPNRVLRTETTSMTSPIHPKILSPINA